MHEITRWLVIIAIFGVPTVLVAMPAIYRERSRLTMRAMLMALGLSLSIVVLPLFGFLASSIIGPDSKQECRHGWLDCFVQAKVILVPMVFWATAALYAIEVLKVENRTRPFIVIGIVSGAIIGVVCLMYEATCTGYGWEWCDWQFICRYQWPLLFPGYVAVWYVVRAVQLLKSPNLSFTTYLFSIISTVPFWVGSYLLSLSIYSSLPEKSDGCFVVTAAGRGHRFLVGPFAEITRNGRKRQVNRQLLTFWELEARWQAHFPRGHGRFRRVYNRIGPEIAARVKTSWQADAVFLALKPLEVAARWFNRTIES